MQHNLIIIIIIIIIITCNNMGSNIFFIFCSTFQNVYIILVYMNEIRFRKFNAMNTLLMLQIEWGLNGSS